MCGGTVGSKTVDGGAFEEEEFIFSVFFDGQHKKR
jgi:hypothetical protein